MLFAAIAAGAEAVKTGSALASTFSQHPKDAERLAAAQAALPRAIAGDLSQAQYILQQRFHSATAYGKQQFANAWQQLQAANPGVAQQALQWGQTQDAFNTEPSVKQTLLNEYNSLVANIREDVGNTLQRVGSGLATGAAGAVDPNTSRYTLPISSSTIWMLAIVALAIGAVLLLTKKRT